AARLNELAGEELVRAHHGSVAREQRLEIEDALKAGKLPALVATSSLELGIDMGAIDLVVQVESPASVASGLQRIGRPGHQVLENVLDMLAGRYPSDEFAELRPRIIWDRASDTLRARAGARVLAITSGGTIPDRGLYGVFTPEGTRVGELDEEMVYESRVGETFVLGATTWRIEEITRDRVVATPAPGQPGNVQFWPGDGC